MLGAADVWFQTANHATLASLESKYRVSHLPSVTNGHMAATTIMFLVIMYCCGTDMPSRNGLAGWGGPWFNLVLRPIRQLGINGR